MDIIGEREKGVRTTSYSIELSQKFCSFFSRQWFWHGVECRFRLRGAPMIDPSSAVGRELKAAEDFFELAKSASSPFLQAYYRRVEGPASA